MNKSTTMSFSLSTETAAGVERYAAILGTSKSMIANSILSLGLKALDDVTKMDNLKKVFINGQS